MKYSEARTYLKNVARSGSRLGLESMRLLMEELGNPQDNLHFVHVAGTNGKGSVMACLEQILICSGLKVGRYLSPVLSEYEEMIRLQGENIPKRTLARLTGVIRDAAERLKQEKKPLPTIFEVETAMAFLYFSEKQCDLVLLECGMGGKEDATNVIRSSDLCVFASISEDHMQYLGNSVEEIARVKSGILKENARAVSAAQRPEAAAVLIEECEKKRIPIRFADPGMLQKIDLNINGSVFQYRDRENLEIGMLGAIQPENAALALEAADELRRIGYPIPEEAVRKGLREARWPGRFEVLCRSPLIIMDGAHNPDAAARLMESVPVYFRQKDIFYVFGVFSDKEYDKIIRITAPFAKKIFTVQTKGNPRALPAADLAEAVRKINHSVVCAGSVRKACRMALEEAKDESGILIFGSLSFLAEAKRAVSSLLGSRNSAKQK